MKDRKLLSSGLAALLMLSLTACGQNPDSSESETTDKANYKEFTGIYAARIPPIDEDNNDIQQLIAEKTGVILHQQFIPDEGDIAKKFSDMMIENKFPDYMAPDAQNCQKLIRENAFVPLDNYWDEYPNLKALYTDEEWDMVRAADGHIYYIPLFSAENIKSTNPVHSGEAFWLQVKVLEWGGYPEIKTLDDYFGLIERYLAANPVDENGEPYYGYEVEANDTWFFALDNPPMFLDGYPNDGCCIVDPVTHEAKDYNLSPTAEKWFRKLNEEYQKGVIDHEAFFLTADQYQQRIASGRVLGMVDQRWNFDGSTNKMPPECTYIPFGVTIDENVEERYRERISFNGSTGVGVSVSCTDPDGAIKFLSDLITPEIHNLRFWVIEGEDYTVGKDGIFEQDEKQYANWRNEDVRRTHFCEYTYMPMIQGMAPDGINAYIPSNQPNIYYAHLQDCVKKCFDAYGVQTYTEMLNEPPENEPWYPMWSFSNAVTEETDYGKAMKQINSVKHRNLPLIVMNEDFDTAWNNYLEEYSKVDSQVYFDELTAEVARRCAK